MSSMKSALPSLCFSLLLVASLSLGCGDEGGSTPEAADAQGNSDAQAEPQEEADPDAALLGCVTWWSESYSQRFLAGETFFLPALASEGACEGLSWSLVEAPEESSAELQGEGEERRLTPLVSGDYRFVLMAGERMSAIAQALEVIDPLKRPFHNYNYFPSHRVAAQVADELWVAGVYTPEVARLDVASGEALEPILVGQWPTAIAYAESAGVVLVANKASDTLGVIDLASRTQSDAIWVGDEPSDIVWDEARGRAYVSLAGAGQLAIVDLSERQLVETLDVVFDPLALAMSPDGQTLAVASHRSGRSNLYPHDQREVESEQDVALVDLESLTLSGHILEVAATIQAMAFDEEGLWLTATSGNPEGPLNDPESMSFVHELFRLAPSPGPALRSASVDLSRQATSAGSTATIHGFALCADDIWVVAEGSNQALALDPESLEERRRVEVEGRPRALSCVDGAPWIISSNLMQVTKIDEDEVDTFSLGLTERREQRLIDGLARFTGQGLGPGDNRSCNNCHADGLSDNQIWNAGPVESRLMSRPLRWLEGTSMIGWDGYVGSVKISGYVGGATINDRGDTQSSLAMGAYLASMMPSPPANSATQRDGALSDEALVGKALFEGKAACTGCHSGEVFTNQAVMDNGLTEGRTDVPSLVDVARIGSWYKTGVMPTLHDTVLDTAEKFGVELTEAEVQSLTRYLEELTGRDFFPLHVDLGPNAEAFAVDGEIRLTFSYPVLESDENLERLTLSEANGSALALRRRVDGRHVTLTPEDTLSPSTAYTLKIEAGFMADDARVTREASYPLVSAAPASLQLEGVYELSVWVPMFQVGEGGFDMEDLVEQTSQFTATPTDNGADVQMNFGGNMFYDDVFVVDGATLMTRHLPIPLGPSFLNAAPIVAEAEDNDGDGVIDLVEGTVVLSGPGIHWTDIAYRITKITLEPGACVPSSEGDTPPVVTQEGDQVIISWGSVGALSLLVTSPEASLPLGPGVVTGGEAYWAIASDAFPETFFGPVTYGQVPEGASDLSVDNGAPLGGAPLESGTCYRFSVVTDLKYSHTVMLWP